MKLNSFQKLSLIMYIITLITLILIVPFKSLNNNGFYIEYDFIWSNRNNIDFFRFFIFILISSIVFYLLIRFYKKYDDYSNQIFNKKLLIEKKVFILYSVLILGVISFLLITNLSNNYKINSDLKEIKSLQKKYYLDNPVKNGLTIKDNDILIKELIKYKDEGGSDEDLIVFKNTFIYIKTNKLKLPSPEEILNQNKFIPPPDGFVIETKKPIKEIKEEIEKYKVFQKLLNSKKREIYDLKTKMYSFNDVIRTLLISNLIIIFVLFISRPTFLFFGTIFNERKY